MASLSIGSKFAVLALVPGILPGRRLNGIMIKAALAKRIAESASDGGLSVSELIEIVSAQFGDMNCYPGNPGDRCHSRAVFVALHGQLRKGKGHYNCAQILEEMVRHVQGRCPEASRSVVLILDAWWHDHYEKWRANIETMKRSGVQVEGYLIGVGGWVAPLPI